MTAVAAAVRAARRRDRRVYTRSHPLLFALLAAVRRRPVARLGRALLVNGAEPYREALTRIPLDRAAAGTTGGAARELSGGRTLFDQEGAGHRDTRRTVAGDLSAAGVARLRPVWQEVLARRLAPLAAGHPVDLVPLARELAGATVRALVDTSADPSALAEAAGDAAAAAVRDHLPGPRPPGTARRASEATARLEAMLTGGGDDTDVRAASTDVRAGCADAVGGTPPSSAPVGGTSATAGRPAPAGRYRAGDAQTIPASGGGVAEAPAPRPPASDHTGAAPATTDGATSATSPPTPMDGDSDTGGKPIPAHGGDGGEAPAPTSPGGGVAGVPAGSTEMEAGLRAMLVVAAVNTTVAALPRAVAWCADAGLWADAGDERLRPALVAELLRVTAPSPLLPRVAAADASLGGCPVRAGDRLVLVARHAVEADRVPPDARHPAPAAVAQLVFGAGRHACPGAGLARAQLEDVLAALAPYRPSVVRARVDRRAALPGWRRLTVRATTVPLPSEA
ncbi:cytochrome P450 [Streptomyces vilmorinianum]|uniref:cytochrome P450 n=1 Tax=Streptomyces vilmorinianum TaxID=3051092 RepID=UPI0010FB056A|nr:cytochrome P450 [Streptomyces vilmorinianum]